MVNLKRNSSDSMGFFVKEEERETAHLVKRSKLSNISNNVLDAPPSQYNPLDEPSPLGLRLKKSPSLLELIEMRLSQLPDSSTSQTNAIQISEANATSISPANSVPISQAESIPVSQAESIPISTSILREKKGGRGKTAAASTEKLKASNFPAMLLRIGDWEFVSRFDGDLVAKCYFAKQKLVWEILQNGLKNKIEIQWPDIAALKAHFPDDGPGTLCITLGRPPHFFKEADPQPRKHTIWQASSDFTNGKASIFRQHVLQCPPGVLNKQYEKLIQCDAHLNLLSQQPHVYQSLYFDERVGVFRNPNASTAHEIDRLDISKRSPISALQDMSSPSSSFTIDEQNSVGFTPEHVSLEAPSPSSVIDLRVTERSQNLRDGFQSQDNLEQMNALGINKSMSMSDLINHIEHRISEFPPSSKEALEGQDVLDDITQFLLSDTNSTINSDEKKLMSRVNSLCCLLQDPNVGQSLDSGTQVKGVAESDKQTVGMSRKDSFSDLLLNLPRIVSMPDFLFDISEGDENQAK